MQFNSLTYIAFFLAVYLLYRITPQHLQNQLLLTASYIFYAWWDLQFLFIIILSTVLNYCSGMLIRTGSISFKQRVFFSTWIISAYFFTVLLQWNHLPALQAILEANIDWRALTGSEDILKIFLVLGITVLIINLLYPKILLFEEKKKRRLFLFIGVSTNLIILGFFKYCNFFLDNIAWLISSSGISPSRFHLDIILPIGISFYTFKGLSYIIDTGRGQIKTVHSYSDFALYMAFFPSVLAGPIDRGYAFMQQISEERKLSWEQSFRGLHLFIYGLFKKVVIADGVIRSVNSIFDSTGQSSWVDVVIAALLFTIQIYCDFSGYTDMARGTAKFFGIDLMVNFRMPYFSINPREFWNRWHISLSSWLRDYLYIPLGGNRFGSNKTYRNLLITMVLGGLWHGAAWNFILWGFYHGLLLSIHRAVSALTKTTGITRGFWASFTKGTFFFILTCYGWLLFRSPSLDKVLSLTSTLVFDFGNMDLSISKPRLAALCGLPVLVIIETVEGSVGGEAFYRKMPTSIWTALYAAMIFCIAIGLTTGSTQFIYMKF